MYSKKIIKQENKLIIESINIKIKHIKASRPGHELRLVVVILITVLL